MVYGQFETIPYYSSPEIQVEGRAIGIAGERDNAQALRGTVKMVSNYSNSLSGGGGGGGGGANGPTAPSNLAATLSGSGADLSWSDNSSDETSFHVESRVSGGSFAEIASLPADSTSFTATGLASGTTYNFRVRAKGAEGFGRYSNTASVTTSAVSTPSEVTASPMSTSSIEVAWQGVPTGTNVTVEMRSPTALYSVVGTADGADGSLVVDGLESESPYTFKVYSSGSGGNSPAVEASATTQGGTGDCRSGSQYLCLLGDRFEVVAEWKKTVEPFENGVGTAGTIPGSDLTGTFWFFSSSNVELLLKMLDGTPLNDHFWHFYGALSDVEYWITVRDTTDDSTVTYHNTPGDICGFNDTMAFLEEKSAAVGPLTTSAGRSAYAPFPASGTDLLEESTGSRPRRAHASRAIPSCAFGTTGFRSRSTSSIHGTTRAAREEALLRSRRPTLVSCGSSTRLT